MAAKESAPTSSPGSDLDRLARKMSPEELRKFRLSKEAEYYKTVEGFLDFVRDCGAAPDAQELPHGRGALEILNHAIEHQGSGVA